jgi:hypothetical protein
VRSAQALVNRSPICSTQNSAHEYATMVPTPQGSWLRGDWNARLRCCPFSHGKERRHANFRRRFRHNYAVAKKRRAYAAKPTSVGAEREELESKARRAETAAHIEGWLPIA